ncbi:putative ABC transporter ATP-binding protein YbbL [Sporotomaculum syntrophicum]|uniref:ABC transporter ATP-binding protein YbbL n=1 Tax=Sporotomaculum syntrophicum TaxID=182264 RepID=A0A9D2WPK3_9FIRM|nr:ATP-binding cassette domain-containing protein [Sporotomaculum syntrophicum]KAF1084785.1 putative ABC transporter ATP-binding protein YbbL [Sporotomaculum syntrophicum]
MLFEFKDINYTLGNETKRNIIVSGAVKNGEVLIVRGPSGAGKSTLFRILSRLRPGSGGEAFLMGKSWLQIPSTSWRINVHYLAQKPTLFDGTVAYNLAKPFETRVGGQRKLDKNRAKELMKQLHLSLELWNQDARTVSGGEASRLAFIRALLVDPVVLLLDEPTAALDEPARQALYQVLSGWLKEPNHTALLISHNNDYRQLEQLKYLDIIEPSKRRD